MRDSRLFNDGWRLAPVTAARPTDTRPPSTTGPKPPSLAAQRRWYVLLGLTMLLGLAIRVAYILIFKRHFVVSGDAFYYHHGANLLVDGHGFIAPDPFIKHQHTLAAAQHPPGYLLALAVPSAFGLRTVLEHQLWSCVLGTATVGVVGLVGKTIANRRVGLIAALLAAIYPNLWLNDSLVMSETLILLTTAVVVLAAYKLWQRPRPAIAAGLGAAIGAAALTRAESILLVPLLAIPLACLLRRFGWRRRLQLAGISIAATAVVLAPWVGYNLTRFDHPVTVSTNLGMTLRVGNCDQTYSGPKIGYWAFQCLHQTNPGHGDLSSQEIVYRHAAVDYINSHVSSVPAVVLARLGRTWALFRPTQQVRLDAFLEWRELWAAQTGLGIYYLLLVASIGGVVLLRRRRVPVLPLLAPALTVTIAVAITVGETRLRAPAEISLVLLAAVALEFAWLDLRARLRVAGARVVEEQLPLVPDAPSPTAGAAVGPTTTATSSGYGADRPPRTTLQATWRELRARVPKARARIAEEQLPLVPDAPSATPGAAVGRTMGTGDGNGAKRPTATLKATVGRTAGAWRESASAFWGRLTGDVSRSRAWSTLTSSPQWKRLRSRSGRVFLLVVAVGTAIAIGTAIVVSSGSTAAAPPAARTKFPTRIVKLPGGRSPKANPKAPARIVDPSQDRPNPFVLVTGGKYYLYSSQSGTFKSPNVPVWVSTDFTHWTSVKETLPKLPNWATWGSTWAPDVRRVNGRYVMYFTALVKGRSPATRCIGNATASSPTGPFKPVQRMLVCQVLHRGTIDPRTFVDTDGTLWLHFKSDDNANAHGDSHTAIYAQRLTSDGLRLTGSRRVILRADQAWEGRIVEAPQMVLANGHYWMFYSGNWYNQPKYAIGVARCQGPAGPCTKPPRSRPFIGSNAQGRGPGESSLFTDGNGLWIVYGPLAVEGREPTRRPVALAHIVFNGIGPNLGAF
ncbi:MAG TPA: family 43 glycosylhydrolase [Acidimicrobiia bacterium]|jgi:4-amino-4-deoxy-L-arabinose transferase-like glycosyltransferase|nr:family 43 glycosylhydrolase [Acidimicrobiia bacterium]